MRGSARWSWSSGVSPKRTSSGCAAVGSLVGVYRYGMPSATAMGAVTA